jgi:predicted Zn-dependent peptidase
MSVYERHTLSNGLRVLTAPLGHAKSVACYIMLAAGSRYENASNRGIAHFAEHMFFKGTERRPTARDLSMEVDTIGGEFNAFTSKEFTGYYIRCAGEQRDTALDVLVDMLRNSKFDADELEREKGVIVEEMNMYVDTPRDYVSSVYEELVFGANPLGWETLGTKDTIKAATRETFLDYLGEWYTPPRIVVGVAGAVGNDLLPTLEGLLGDMTGEDAGTLFSQAGVDLNRAEEAVEVIATEFRKLADEVVPAQELEKARALAKGRFVLQTESPNGLIMFGLRREVLEGRAAEPEDVLAGLDAVTAEDVQRVAQDVIGSQGMRCAVIGPFDDASVFEKLL